MIIINNSTDSNNRNNRKEKSNKSDTLCAKMNLHM